MRGQSNVQSFSTEIPVGVLIPGESPVSQKPKSPSNTSSPPSPPRPLPSPLLLSNSPLPLLPPSFPLLPPPLLPPHLAGDAEPWLPVVIRTRLRVSHRCSDLPCGEAPPRDLKAKGQMKTHGRVRSHLVLYLLISGDARLRRRLPEGARTRPRRGEGARRREREGRRAPSGSLREWEEGSRK